MFNPKTLAAFSLVEISAMQLSVFLKFQNGYEYNDESRRIVVQIFLFLEYIFFRQLSR